MNLAERKTKMKRWVFVLLVIFAVSVVLTVAFGIAERCFEMRVKDHGKADGPVTVDVVCFTSGGGMNGGHTYIKAKREGESDIINISIDILDYWNGPELKKEYKADKALFDKISEIIVESKFWKAEHRPKSRIQVLDAPSESFEIKLRNGKWFTAEDCKVLSQQEWDAWHDIIELLKDESFKTGE